MTYKLLTKRWMSSLALIFLAPICGHTATNSEMISNTRELAEKTQVLKQAKKYASAIACGTTFDGERDEKEVLKHIYKIDINNGMKANYVVFWRGNAGCIGGNAADRSYLTLFNRQYDDKSFVRDYETEDILDSINQQSYIINTWGVYDAKVIDKDVIVIRGYDFVEGDNPSFPSLEVESKFRYDDSFNQWVMLN